MTDASSNSPDLEPRVHEMGRAMVQLQQDLEFWMDRIHATLVELRAYITTQQVGGNNIGRMGRPNYDTTPGFITQKPKLEPPKRDGTEPLHWLYQVQEYFTCYELPLGERLSCATTMLEGVAADWYRWTRNNGLISDWDDFVRKFILRFNPLHYVDYLGKLAQTRHIGAIMDYHAAFEKIPTHVADVQESTLQSLYHAGLKAHLQHEISLLKPTSLSESFALARN
ncbi:unnamed protein product [Cuscuta campestris]|uniref:Retrotransposon gag domain-containing protein n=1 Tax=Cuscuta campestris TaxID=132261 RepID=A0A484MEQ2_9ASTE|nr:unnamed protein product [Cuscuta campestris]